MAGFKKTLEKGITTLNVKTNNFMEVSKCRTYIDTLEKEINVLKSTIGNSVYDNWINNEDAMKGIEGGLQKIKEKEEKIREQKEKIIQLSEEEKQIFGVENEQTAVEEGIVYCSQCGTPSTSNFKFCIKCGASLKD